jgi:hypothetical protein
MGDFLGMLMGGEESGLTRPKKHIRFELTYFIFCHHIIYHICSTIPICSSLTLPHSLPLNAGLAPNSYTLTPQQTKYEVNL